MILNVKVPYDYQVWQYKFITIRCIYNYLKVECYMFFRCLLLLAPSFAAF